MKAAWRCASGIDGSVTDSGALGRSAGCDGIGTLAVGAVAGLGVEAEGGASGALVAQAAKTSINAARGRVRRIIARRLSRAHHTAESLSHSKFSLLPVSRDLHPAAAPMRTR